VLGSKKNFLLVSSMEDMGFSITFKRVKVLICPENVISDNVVVIWVKEGTLYRL
jgi:hypothetical protein